MLQRLVPDDGSGLAWLQDELQRGTESLLELVSERAVFGNCVMEQHVLGAGAHSLLWLHCTALSALSCSAVGPHAHPGAPVLNYRSQWIVRLWFFHSSMLAVDTPWLQVQDNFNNLDQTTHEASLKLRPERPEAYVNDPAAVSAVHRAGCSSAMQDCFVRRCAPLSWGLSCTFSMMSCI
jgi:hypothetical protein